MTKIRTEMTDLTSGTDKVRLPNDPDLDVEQTPGGDPRPLHLRLPSLALVCAGGTLGTAAREAISLAVPPIAGIPVAIFGINILGAFLLGMLLESLARRGPDHGRRRTARLLLGTGVMGGFTTYSALATESASLLGGGAATSGIAYGILTVLVGAAATWAGIAAGSAAHRARDRATQRATDRATTTGESR